MCVCNSFLMLSWITRVICKLKKTANTEMWGTQQLWIRSRAVLKWADLNELNSSWQFLLAHMYTTCAQAHKLLAIAAYSSTGTIFLFVFWTVLLRQREREADRGRQTDTHTDQSVSCKLRPTCVHASQVTYTHTHTHTIQSLTLRG